MPMAARNQKRWRRALKPTWGVWSPLEQRRQPLQQQQHLAPPPLPRVVGDDNLGGDGKGSEASRLEEELSRLRRGGARAVEARRLLLERLRRNATLTMDVVLARELRWEFGPNEVDEDALELERCLGKGSYGMVFEGSVRGGPGGIGAGQRARKVVVKVPTIRHWGFRFYRSELDALLAVRATTSASAGVESGGETVRLAVAAKRNVVRLLGNTSISVDELMTLEPESDRWGCVNRTDLQIGLDHGARVLPAMLLEPLSNTSLFKWLTAVAAPKEGVSLSMQRRFFQLQHARATADPELAAAFASAFDVLLGFARGVALLHSLHLVHRDLTEPGKNVLLRRERGHLTATLIDLSQAQRCPAGRGAAARSVDMYSFGHVIYLACYGHVVRGLPWTKFSCNGSPKALAELLPIHEAAHPAVCCPVLLSHPTRRRSPSPNYSARFLLQP